MSDFIPVQEAGASGSGKVRVKPASIESELEKIRTAAENVDAQKEAAQTGGSAAARIRVTLSNLILLRTDTKNFASPKTVDHLIDEICVNYPSRFFIVDGELTDDKDTDGAGIASAISSRCFLAESGAHICSEEVYVSVKPMAIPLVHHLLVSLLVPDVDVVLMVLGDPRSAGKGQNGKSNPAKELLNALRGVTDTIVYDSAHFEDYTKSICEIMGLEDDRSRLLSVLKTESRRISDLAWRRLRRWRNLVAEGFDAPKIADRISSLKQISLGCRLPVGDLQKGRIPADVLLMAGWLASSLNLMLNHAEKSEGGVRIHCRYNDADLALDIHSSVVGVSGSALTLGSTEFVIDGKSGGGRLRIERSADNLSADVSLTVAGSGGNEYATRSAPFLEQRLEELVLLNIAPRPDETEFYAALDRSLKLAEMAKSAV